MTSLQISQYSLYSIDNYKKTINVTINDIFEKYNLLIIEYFKLNITGKFIISRGLDTISHVFELMLFYTKNIDMTYYHSQKAFYFYGEFISQIIEDPNNYLQLSSKDASLFVYKKTIFEIMQKNVNMITEEDKHKLSILNIYITILKKICENNTLKYIELVVKQLNNPKFDKEYYELILLFVQNVSKQEDIILVFITTLSSPFDKKILRKNIENIHLIEGNILINLFIDHN